MASRQFMYKCRKCKKPTLHVGPSTSHVLHLLLTIVTAGVWLVIWLLVGVSNSSQGACSECGRRRGLFG